MRRIKLLLFCILLCTAARSQQVETIVFNLYTDSLKKGFFNYISVDGQFADGRWLPLDSSHLKLWANTGYFKGNDLFIDSSYLADSVVVRAALRNNPRIHREVIIYIRKRGFDEPLKTKEEVLEPTHPRSRKQKHKALTTRTPEGQLQKEV